MDRIDEILKKRRLRSLKHKRPEYRIQTEYSSGSAIDYMPIYDADLHQLMGNRQTL